MRISRKGSVLLLFVAALAIALPALADTSANVAGRWTIQVSGAAGAATQRIEITQDGTKITGKFKGARQSGTLDGTVIGNAIVFHVKAHVPIDYTGTVDGDTMKGTLTGRGKTGDWVATREK